MTGGTPGSGRLLGNGKHEVVVPPVVAARGEACPHTQGASAGQTQGAGLHS